VFYSASEAQFQSAFRVSQTTFKAIKTSLLVHAPAGFCRRRGGDQLRLDRKLSIALFRMGHCGNACPVDAVAGLFGVSIGCVIKSTRRFVKALAGMAPHYIRWLDTRRRAGLARYAAEKFGFDSCIGATDGTTFPLAYQPALHPWTYYDRKQRYGLNGLITCDWECRITNVVLGCTGAAPDTYVQLTAAWHRRPNIYFSAGQYL